MPVSIYISYAQQDEDLCEELVKHFAVPTRAGLVDLWHRREILPGEERKGEINEKLESAALILLLVSADFMASDYCFDVELKKAMELHEAGATHVIPILVRSTSWRHAPFGHLRILPVDGQAVDSRASRDEAWTEVVEGVKQALEREFPNVAYRNEEDRKAAQELEAAFRLQEELLIQGEDTTEVDTRILELRRFLREGGHLRPGDFLADGRFQLGEVIGQGGFGLVWKALDRRPARSSRLVAIKVLHGQFEKDRSQIERFVRGARKMAELHHPGIVRVLEPQLDDHGKLFFVMEYLPGGDLRRAILCGDIQQSKGLEIVLALGEALAFAHRAGVVHRDVKPANVLLDGDRRPRLTDFDLVLARDTTGGTRTEGMGTFLYAAPECHEDARVATAAADVFSLGMTAVFVIFGQDLPADVLRDTPKFLAGLKCDLAVRLVLEKAITWEVEGRFDSMAEFCDALRTALVHSRVDFVPVGNDVSGLSPSALEPEPSLLKQVADRVVTETTKWSWRWWAVYCALFALFVVMAGWGVTRWEEWQESDAETGSDALTIALGHPDGHIAETEEVLRLPVTPPLLPVEDEDQDAPRRQESATIELRRFDPPGSNAELMNSVDEWGSGVAPVFGLEPSSNVSEVLSDPQPLATPRLRLQVIGRSDSIPIVEAPGSSEVLSTMEPLRPYYVVGNHGDSYEISLSKAEDASLGFVSRKDVESWNTREGLHFIDEIFNRNRRRSVVAWKFLDGIEAFWMTEDNRAYGPTFKEEFQTRPGIYGMIPYPVLDSRMLSDDEGRSKRVYQVLLPTTAVTFGTSSEKISTVAKAVTFCVVFDATASMGKHARRFADTLDQMLVNSGVNGHLASAGFVLFRDLSDAHPFEVVFPMPLEDAADWLRHRIHTMEGGDKPAEPVLDAVALAQSSFLWNGGTAVRYARRIMIVVANEDARPETIGLTSKIPEGLDAKEVAWNLRSNSIPISVFALQAGNQDRGYLIKVLSTLADETGGEFYSAELDSGRINSQFWKRIDSLLDTHTDEELQRAVVPAYKQPGATIIALDLLDSNSRSRLEAAATDFSISEGGLLIESAWVFEDPTLYSEKILVGKELLEDLVRLFRILADSALDSASLQNQLKEMTGVEIPPHMDVQELLEWRLGVRFTTNLLSFELDQLAALGSEERSLQQESLQSFAIALDSFLDQNAHRFYMEPRIWMPASYLP